MDGRAESGLASAEVLYTDHHLRNVVGPDRTKAVFQTNFGMKMCTSHMIALYARGKIHSLNTRNAAFTFQDMTLLDKKKVSDFPVNLINLKVPSIVFVMLTFKVQMLAVSRSDTQN